MQRGSGFRLLASSSLGAPSRSTTFSTAGEEERGRRRRAVVLRVRRYPTQRWRPLPAPLSCPPFLSPLPTPTTRTTPTTYPHYTHNTHNNQNTHNLPTLAARPRGKGGHF